MILRNKELDAHNNEVVAYRRLAVEVTRKMIREIHLKTLPWRVGKEFAEEIKTSPDT